MRAGVQDGQGGRLKETRVTLKHGVRSLYSCAAVQVVCGGAEFSIRARVAHVGPRALEGHRADFEADDAGHPWTRSASRAHRSFHITSTQAVCLTRAGPW